MSASLYQSATQTNPDGSVVTLQTTFLSEPDVVLLGEYESWLSRARLYRRFVCRTCGPDCEVQALIEPHQIGIACGHRLLLYQGHVPVRLTMEPVSAGETVLVVRSVIPNAPITVADAYMLRRYQRFLNTHALQEALWCLKCEDEGAPSGITADVTVNRMVLLCRCTRRLFSGLAA